jgi:hypothetical protein
MLLLAVVGVSAALLDYTPTEQYDPFFVGLWRVDQPMHALYEATLYDFRPDGELVTLETVTLGGREADYVTGTVARLEDPTCVGMNCPTQIVCRFGGRWHSVSERRLVIEGVCSDNMIREIILDLTPIAGSDLFTAEVVSVGGERGWAHHDFEWSWARCASRDECLPAFAR